MDNPSWQSIGFSGLQLTDLQVSGATVYAAVKLGNGMMRFTEAKTQEHGTTHAHEVVKSTTGDFWFSGLRMDKVYRYNAAM